MTALLTWIWQGLAIAGLTAAVLACAPRLGAASRHAIWWTACAGVLALPAAYLLLAFSASAPAAATAAVVVPAAPDRLTLVLGAAWLAFAAVASIRLAASVAAVRRLKRTSEPMDQGLVDRIGRSRAAHLIGRIRVSDRIAGACALGLGSPVILLSSRIVTHMDDEALAAIVLHEQAHLDRRDDWWQLLQAAVITVAGWHPALWFITRRIAVEREAACDDRAIGSTSDVRQYAHALVQAAELRHAWTRSERMLAIPGAAVSASTLRRRVVRMLDSRIDRQPRPARSTRCVVAATVLLLVLGAARAPILVAFEEVTAVLPGAAHTWVASLKEAVTSTAVTQAAAVRIRPRPAAPSLAVTSAPRHGIQQTLAATSTRLPADAVLMSAPDPSAPAAPVAAEATLDARIVPQLSSSSSQPVTTPGPSSPSAAAPWISLGQHMSRGGVSVGRFFTRAARNIAHHF